MSSRIPLKLAITWVAVVLLAACLACDRSKPQGPYKNPFVYPLSVGNRWQYSGRYFYSNVQPDSLLPMFSDTLFSTSTVEITGLDTLFDTTEVYVFHERYGWILDTVDSDAYFKNLGDGFYYYGATSMNYVAPLKPHPFANFSFRGHRFHDICELFEMIEGRRPVPKPTGGAVEYHDPPLKSLAYPLRTGCRWTFREPAEPWRIDKLIGNWRSIEVPAGRFGCFPVRWLHEMDNDRQWDIDIEFYDYISQVGLVKRAITIRGITLTSPVSPDSIGTADVTTEYTLMGHDVSSK